MELATLHSRDTLDLFRPWVFEILAFSEPSMTIVSNKDKLFLSDSEDFKTRIRMKYGLLHTVIVRNDCLSTVRKFRSLIDVGRPKGMAMTSRVVVVRVLCSCSRKWAVIRRQTRFRRCRCKLVSAVDKRLRWPLVRYDSGSELMSRVVLFILLIYLLTHSHVL